MKKFLLFLSIAMCSVANAQYTKLHNFVTVPNGITPWGDLVSSGSFLFGITQQGGINNTGTLFKIMPDGTGYAKLFDFDTINGSYPSGSLISDGTFLYGMAKAGGTKDSGVIFKIMPDGTGFAKLLDFSGTATGGFPWGSLISDGTFLYGMTSRGGINNLGTIFKIMPNGTGYTKLLDFAGTANGSTPYGSLVSDGTFLYGMTLGGGANSQGTIFKIMPDGTGYTKLLDFAGAANGHGPWGSLISDGTFLYGMTKYGGTNDSGIVFKIMPDGTGYTKLLDFSGAANGSFPYGSLISDGTYLYGMTYYGGTNNKGAMFKMMLNGTGYSKLIDFTGFAGVANGGYPYGSLISDGTFLYGMTSAGGSQGGGAVFKYNPYCTSVTFSQSDSICEGQNITVGSNTYTMSGTYIDTLTASSSCDSIVTTNLTVLPDTSFSQSLTINQGDSIIVGSNTYTVGGTYIDTLLAVNGCDSIVTTNLTVISGINDMNENKIKMTIKPNPFSSVTTLQTDIFFKDASLTVFNSVGQTVKRIDNLAGQTVVLQRDNLPSGLYFVRLTQDSIIFSADKLVIVD